MMSVSKPLLVGIVVGFLFGAAFVSLFYDERLPARQNRIAEVHMTTNSRRFTSRPTTGPSTSFQRSTARTTLGVGSTTRSPRSSIKWPPGFAVLSVSAEPVSADMPPRQAETNYYRFVARKEVHCEHHVRLGNAADGGWDLCIVPPYDLNPAKGCLVYSFGINNDWSFDDAISRRYNCDVRAFDPSMKIKDHKRSNKISFYQTGIGETDTVNPLGWKLRTFDSLLKEMGDSEKIIDYLKMDVEYSEWGALKSMLKTGSLSKVKQFAFEVHTQEVQNKPTSVAQFAMYYDILLELEKQGFRRWYWHFNHFGRYYSRRSMSSQTCCHELVYVNTNFLLR